MAEVGVGFNGSEFQVKVPFALNEKAKNAPDRTWNKTKRVWVLPDNGPNRRYIKRNFDRVQISAKALEVLDQETPQEFLGFFPEGWDWALPPMSQQESACRWAWDKKGIALFHEMGLGKTYTIINLASARWLENQIDALLVICPTSIKDVWAKEFQQYATELAPVRVHVHAAGLDKQTEEFIDDGTAGGMKVLVVGVESLSSQPAKRIKQGASKWQYTLQHSNSGRLAKKFCQTRRAMVACDESSTIKNSKALRTELAWDIAEHCVFRVIGTGTDVTQGLHDLYAQFRFLDWEIIGAKTFALFKRRFCVEEQVPGQKAHVRRIVGYQNTEELMALVTPWIHQRLKKDCLDLPPKVFEERTVRATKEQLEFTKALKKTLVAEFKGKRISVSMALEAMLRFQQVSGGFAPYLEGEDDKGRKIFRTQALDRNPKLDELMSVLEEVRDDVKVIIWARFQDEIRAIGEAIRAKYGPTSAGLFYGPTSEDDRSDLTKRFQDPHSRLRFMVANQAVGGMGQTWTAATLVIYYSQSASYVERVQSEDRAHRKGQEHPVTYVDLRTTLPVDGRIKMILDNKGELADFADEVMALLTE